MEFLETLTWPQAFVFIAGIVAIAYLMGKMLD